jgi:hypothetical protein
MQARPSYDGQQLAFAGGTVCGFDLSWVPVGGSANSLLLFCETLFVSLPHARTVLDTSRADYNGVRPHSALANRTPEEFRAPHIAIAANAATVKTSTQGLYS